MATKDYGKLSIAFHKKNRGKIGTAVKGKLESRDDWSIMYTPGVGAVSTLIAQHPELARTHTAKGNTVAVVSDGSAVLGLGNLGPLGALPVMEGKAAIFKIMGGVDAVPVVLDTQDTKEIIRIVKAIAPTYGGINLEDISAPRCFEIEEALKKELDIPVFHDDQHGTAIVVLAGLINAAKVVKKDIKSLRVVIAGAGAAGTAVMKLMHRYGIRNIIMSDTKGIIVKGRAGVAGYKNELATMTNPEKRKGNLADALVGADVFVGVSGPNTMTRNEVALMAPSPIIFALSNPVPEISPDEAKAGGAMVVATGRSDYPNQVNNALVFPGIFRGALDTGVTAITDDMKIAAAEKIAKLVKKPTAEEIIPHVTTKGLVKAVASVVR